MNSKFEVCSSSNNSNHNNNNNNNNNINSSSSSNGLNSKKIKVTTGCLKTTTTTATTTTAITITATRIVIKSKAGTIVNTISPTTTATTADTLQSQDNTTTTTATATTTTATATTTATDHVKAEKTGDLSSNGSVSQWSVGGVGEQYQQGYFPQYQYPQQAVYPDQSFYHHHQVYQQSYYFQPHHQHQHHHHHHQQQQHHHHHQQYSGQVAHGGGQQVQQSSLGPEQHHAQQQQVHQQHHQVQQQQQHQVQQHQGAESGQCWECSAVLQDAALLRNHVALFHPYAQVFSCSLCPHVFPSHTQLAHHYTASHLVGEPVNSPEGSSSSSQRQAAPDSKGETEAPPHLKPKKTPTKKRPKARPGPAAGSEAPRQCAEGERCCVPCLVSSFPSQAEFEAHHVSHVRERSVRVRLKPLTRYQLRKAKVKVESRKKNSSSLKLKLKISKVGRGRGRKRREVKILSEEGMSDTPNSFQDQEGLEAEPQEESEGREEGGAAAAATAAAEWEESGGDSEEQEASRSSAEPQESEERLEQDSLPGHDELGAAKEQDGQQEDLHYPQQEQDYHQQEQDYQQEDQDYQQEQQQEQQQQEQEQEQEQDYPQDYPQDLSEQSDPPEQDKEEEGYREGGEQSDGSNSGFNPEFSEQELQYGEAEGGDAQQAYQPQFESYPTASWFTDYESGPRIAAAMAGATATENASDGGAWAGGAEGAANPSYSGGSSPQDKGSSGGPVNGGTSEGDGEDGLFSQAVLGQESPEKSDRQGSFEQLCLNDSFSGQGEGEGDEDPQQQQQQQQQDQLASSHEQQQQGAGVASDLLSELEYLNNSGQAQGDLQPGSQPGSQSGQIDGSPHSGGPSPHSGGPSPHSAGPGTPSHLSSRGSNSGTPTSSGGHPTPPPSDTSFRALATSPITSPTQQPTSPSLHKGATPPVTSPLQQIHSPQQAGEQQQQQQQQQQAGSVPRLTIANNLMASTTSAISSHLLASTTTTSQAGVGMMGRYGQQWSQAAGYTGAAGYPGLPGTTIASTNMPGPLRAPLPPNVGMQYRPSPPPRVRGRPPLIGHVGRPPLHQAAHLQPTRGPGRPPASSILPPPLMPAPGGRGGMMPPLQRMHQPMYPGQRPAAPQQQSAAGKRQMLGAAGHSPSKTARREDINVPSRQKDNECQIIAVANRSDGLPVISNVQGGSAAPAPQRASGSGSVPATTESTINLSDSITLSVRASAGGKDGGGRGERGGPEAGAVANLLASRGITVTPAAGERQDGGSGRDDRRLPTAQELNLSSAISVHPPTQREREGSGRERDRDGFAVPQAPPTRSSVSNSNVERPPRPPTVDLTQDVPASGAQGTRHKCHQCDRSFPTASLLADHSRVHQQQQQSRMPFKCHLCTAGFSTQKGQQHHYQQFHQLHLSAGDVAIPLVDLRSPVNVQRMAALGIRSFLPLTNLQNRGAGGVVGVPILTLENLRNGHMTLQQWGVSDVLSLGPAKTLNMPR